VEPIPQWTPIDPSVTALGLRVRALRRPTDRGLVVALIPASDEEDQIQAAVRSLQAQDAPPDLIVVDAEPDDVLDIVLCELADEDAILVMDSCCVLAPTFLSAAVERLGDGIGGVGGVYSRSSVRGLGWFLKTGCLLTGAPTLFSVRTLRHIMWAREKGVLPEGRARLYDASAGSDYDELPLALRHLGYKVVSPKGRALTIDLSQSWRNLYERRLRRRRRATTNVSPATGADGTAGAAVLGSLRLTGPPHRGA
jgi:poly-beta-1,6-N-acetyl-D-glucosamine synthase